MLYCPNCRLLVEGSLCPVCGSKKLRQPEQTDYCFLTEQNTIWAGALEELLRQDGVAVVTQNVLGAGLAARIGPAQEKVRFYVPFSDFERALEVKKEFAAE